MWGKQREDLCASLIQQSLSSNRLVDLDWKFGVTASSDEMASVGRTFLQLQITLEEEEIVVELSLPKFYEFMAEMVRVMRIVSRLIVYCRREPRLTSIFCKTNKINSTFMIPSFLINCYKVTVWVLLIFFYNY